MSFGSQTYVMPSLMLLVVEVMTVLSRPVCCLSTSDRALMSPDNTAVLTWKPRYRNQTDNLRK